MVRKRIGICIVAVTIATLAAAPAWPTPAMGARAVPISTLHLGEFNTDISDEFGVIPDRLVIRAIRASHADVVALEEGAGQIPTIARALGWPYYDVRMQLVSRLPLIDPPGGDGRYTYIEVSPGRVVAIENIHLPSDPYGPTLVQKGASLKRVLALEKTLRVPAVTPALATARRLQHAGVPVFLTGDFNTPSWRDWTRSVVHSRPFLNYAVRWPVSVVVEKAGFRDSFRTVHPNPSTTPGLTWPAHRVIHVIENYPPLPADRIDFIYATKPAQPTASILVGEPGGAGVTIPVTKWPSDHRMIVSTFRVRGAPTGVLITTDHRRVLTGVRLRVSWWDAAATARRVVISSTATATIVDSQPLTAQAAGVASFASATLAAGGYAAQLLDATGAVLTSYPFWVVAPGAVPTVTPTSPVFAKGAPITVAIANAPGDRWDWLGVYPLGADPLKASYIAYAYTHSVIDGQIVVDRHTAVAGWPIPPGRYSLYLLVDDLYVKVAATTITIR